LNGAVTRARATVVTVLVVGLGMFAIGGEHPFQGPVLVGFNEDHGVHLSDPFIVAAVVVALALVWLPRRR
jgi:hypothetical protein